MIILKALLFSVFLLGVIVSLAIGLKATRDLILRRHFNFCQIHKDKDPAMSFYLRHQFVMPGFLAQEFMSRQKDGYLIPVRYSTPYIVPSEEMELFIRIAYPEVGHFLDSLPADYSYQYVGFVELDLTTPENKSLGVSGFEFDGKTYGIFTVIPESITKYGVHHEKHIVCKQKETLVSLSVIEDNRRGHIFKLYNQNLMIGRDIL